MIEKKKSVKVDFAECVKCGSDDVEISTKCDEDGYFFDGDEAQCRECGLVGQFNCDTETPGYVSWEY